jgi:PEGA domain/Gram-negative bacterial TonB protein C-terminal
MRGLVGLLVALCVAGQAKAQATCDTWSRDYNAGGACYDQRPQPTVQTVIQVSGDTLPRQSILLVHVSREGNTVEARVFAASDRQSFDVQALGLVGKMRWIPATKNGQQVDAWVLMGVIPSATPPATQFTSPPVAEPPAPPVTVETQGFLTLDAYPLGTVFIDGVKVGDVPITRYGVTPGVHTIRIECSGYKTQTFQVQVDAGHIVRKRITLTPAG